MARWRDYWVACSLAVAGSLVLSRAAMKLRRSRVALGFVAVLCGSWACSGKQSQDAPAPPSASSPEGEEDAPSAAPEDESAGRRYAVPPYVSEALDAADRTEADRALDGGRHPAEMLTFFGIAPGQKVADLASGGGYTTELLARVVGAEGVVYGQNSPGILAKFGSTAWNERLVRPVMKNVVRVDSEYDAPLPAAAKDLDAVILVLFYHDTVWLGTDRDKMNRAIYAALKPGGVFGVIDHSARAGAGVGEVQTLHRIEESAVVAEIERVGFQLEGKADFMRNPEDTRDWNASPMQAGEKRGTSDRFVLRFVKPLEGKDPSTDGATTCTEPRPEMCTKDYRPVCATVDTGIRCITAPCPSTEQRTYGNACSACGDEKVISHVPGECAAAAPKGTEGKPSK